MKFIFLIFLFIAFVVSPIVSEKDESFNREQTFDVQHYIIRVRFDRKKKIVYGDSTIKFKPIKKGFRILELDAANIKFESVVLEPFGKKLNYTQTNGKVNIFLDRDFEPFHHVSVRMKYTTTKPKKGVYFVPARKKGPLKHSPQIWTQGESEETHHWLPSFDFPSDKSTTEQFITVANSETAVGNGKLVNQTQNNDGTKTFHYKMNQPHSIYLTSFVVGEYRKVSEKYRNIPLNYYVYPGQEKLVSGLYGKTKDMFRIFEELTKVQYQFDKYDQTVVGNFSFGGMENITATTLSDIEMFYGSDKTVEDLVAHELAHSWFGNLVTCKNWAELWLNEGFATYMEAAYREKMYGRSEYIRKIREDANQYFAYASVNKKKMHGLYNRKADASNDNTMFTTITYQKGSIVLHMLREELGEEDFWGGVNLYLQKFKFKNAETTDLQAVFELKAGRKLDWFFKQWVFGNNYPVIKIQQSYSPKSKELVLRTTQSQIGDEFTAKAFRIPLDVEIKTSKTTKNRRIVIDTREQIFRIPLDEKPFNVEIDKDYKVPLKDVSLSKLVITR